MQAREEGGVASLMDVRQAESLVESAAQAIPDFERQLAQTENQISILVGQNPQAIPRGRPLTEQIALQALPPGLTTVLLQRRPDIRQAEQQVVASNARIGAAKALYFPLVQLTGSGGVQLTALNGMFFGPNSLFSIGPSITLPLFNAGRIGAAVDSADARTREAVLRYRQTIQQALREVADALVGHEKFREFRVHQEVLVATLRDALDLATMRYEGGVTSYLEALDTERQRFQAELDLVRARQNELGAVVLLYKALGGGWQTESPLPVPAAILEPPGGTGIFLRRVAADRLGRGPGGRHSPDLERCRCGRWRLVMGRRGRGDMGRREGFVPQAVFQVMAFSGRGAGGLYLLMAQVGCCWPIRTWGGEAPSVSQPCWSRSPRSMRWPPSTVPGWSPSSSRS